MKRREFFTSLGAMLLGASAPATMAMSSTAHVPLAGDRLIAAGNVDSEEVIAALRAEIADANKDVMRQLQRDFGGAAFKWNQRYGA